MSEVTKERLTWLWQDRIPLAAITLLVGDPGLGKSMLSCQVAAKVSRGRLGDAPANVLMISAEDSYGAVIRPRLEATDADLDKVMVIKPGPDGTEDGISLPEDGAKLAALVVENEIRLIIIDPLSAHLSDRVNSWNDQSVRRALGPLHRIAQAQGVAVLVIAHLNKAQNENALYRTGGSIGLPAAARSALLFARDPNDPEVGRGTRRVLAQYKSNLGVQAASLAYEIEPVDLPSVPGEPPFVTARVARVGDSTHTADDLLTVVSVGDQSALAEAADFLKDQLRIEARLATDVLAAAKQEGIAESTLKRARKGLGVQAKKRGFGPGSAFWWSLPEPSSIGGHASRSPRSTLDDPLWDDRHGSRDQGGTRTEHDPIEGQLILWPPMEAAPADLRRASRC